MAGVRAGDGCRGAVAGVGFGGLGLGGRGEGAALAGSAFRSGSVVTAWVFVLGFASTLWFPDWFRLPPPPLDEKTAFVRSRANNF